LVPATLTLHASFLGIEDEADLAMMNSIQPEASRASLRLSGASSTTNLSGLGQSQSHSSILTPNVATSSYFSTLFEPSLNSLFIRSTSDVVRSDYEQEALLKQLAHNENLKLRISRGAGKICDMISPWMHSDRFRNPVVPSWNDYSIKTSHSNADVLMEHEDFIQLIHPPLDVLDFNGNRLTTDCKRQICSSFDPHISCPPRCNCARQVDIISRYDNSWSDMEKAIFVDKFLQFPKRFSKIASYFTNKTTKDCVKFYYDSKATIPYKQLLREMDNRRRNLKNSWSHSLLASRSLGESVYESSSAYLDLTPVYDFWYR
jgi:hypothetical protein